MKKILFMLYAVFFVLSSAAFAADTTIKGTTSDLSTASLEVTSSSDASLLFVRNDGNIGIGTASPSEKLHIGSGNARIASMTTAGFVKNDATGVLTGGNSSVSTPGGSDTQVQFNDGGAFNGDAGFTYNKATTTASINTLNLTSALALAYGGTGATTAVAARTSLGAAASGANSDITSLTAVTSVASSGALTIASGGSNQNITVTPSGTGDVILNGMSQIGASGTPITAILAGTVSVDPPSIGNNQTATFTATITGASTGDLVFLTPPSTIENLIFEGATITATDTVTIKLANESGGNINGQTRTWSYILIKP